MSERYLIGVDRGTTLAKCEIYGNSVEEVVEATPVMEEFDRDVRSGTGQ
jgi:hypothetical protein